MKYNTYIRLIKLFYFEYKTSFEISHRLDDYYTLSVNLDAYRKSHGYPKLYDKSVKIYRYDIDAQYNKCVFVTKNFDELKKWLKNHNFI